MCFQDEGCRRHATGFCEISFSFSAAASQNEAEESDESEDEATGQRTSRVRRPRGGMKVSRCENWRETAKRDRNRR